MEYILHIPQCVARFPFIPRGRRLHIGSIRARAGCPCLAPAIDGSWRSLGTVRTLCRQWVLDTRLAYGLPLCPGSNGRPRCFFAVLSADRSRLASSSISAPPVHLHCPEDAEPSEGEQDERHDLQSGWHRVACLQASAVDAG